MARVIQTGRLEADGLVYKVRVCGRESVDGRWEAWIEFDLEDGSPVMRTSREATQSTLDDLVYWASGLTPTYIEGALSLATDGSVPDVVERLEVPAYEGPAPAPEEIPLTAVREVRDAVKNPVAIYAKWGANELRAQLGALSASQLRVIARTYHLTPIDLDLEPLVEEELIALIMAGVRRRSAA